MKGRSDLLVMGFSLATFLFISCQLMKMSTLKMSTPEKLRQAKSPLKIFVMVGQSNMEGHGYVDKIEDGKFLNGTLEWLVETDPDTYSKLKTVNDDWKTRDDVWIAYNRQNVPKVRPLMNSVGPLAAGYGGGQGAQGHEMGPELGFGWTVGDELGRIDGNGNDDDTDIFLVKVAWGGRSLAVNYRPPSSGGETGLYYEAMLANVYKTLSQLSDTIPGYTPDRGYSIEGFAWHQGWNDGCDKNQTAEYESNLANLIRDVRADLGVPDLPFVVGISGMNGWNPGDPKRTEIAEAQLAVSDAAKYPEFVGTVASVETRDFFREKKPVSPGDQIYHWNNNCESYWLVGQAMGQAMVELVRRRKNEIPPPAAAGVLPAPPLRGAPESNEDDKVRWFETILRGMDVFDIAIE